MAARTVAPFQYPGGKHRIAPLVWEALGEPVRYVEPFAGSLGVLLARPGEHDGYNEVVNDADGFIVNVWRAIRHAPDEVAFWLEGPSTEADLNARHGWLHSEGAERVRAVFANPDHYDAKTAAWFVYGMAFACHPRAFSEAKCSPGRPSKNAGQGPHAGWRQPIDAYIVSLADRLRRAIIFAGDWTRCVVPTVLWSNPRSHYMTGVFLDPPYAKDRMAGLYGTDSVTVADDVRAWCLARGGDEKLRVVLAGYEGEHDQLEDHGWRVASWSSRGGGASSHSERLWFSPHCLNADDGTLRLGEEP